MFGSFLATVVLITGIVNGNNDNNKEKELVMACIQAGGEPQYETRNEAMRGCNRP